MRHLLRWLPALFLAGGAFAQTPPSDLGVHHIGADLRVGAESVVRYESRDFTLLSDREATLTVHRIVTLLNSDSDENQLVVFYTPDIKISRFKATIYDALGQPVRDARKSEIQDVLAVDQGTFYHDRRLQYLTLEHASYPYTVEYSYELKLKDFGMIAYVPEWRVQRWDQSVQQARLRVTLPATNELFYDQRNLAAEPAIATPDGTRQYTWTVADLPALPYEPAAPRPADVLPVVYTALRQFEIEGYRGGMADWPAFGRFIGELFAGRDQLPAAARTEIEQLVADAVTPREKVDRLYRFMQSRMRYVGVQLGIGGWQPFPADYVETNRYGDCKALSNYMGAMLSTVGIESYPVLIYSGDPNYAAHPDFTTSAFNHCILYVPGEDLYLECTSNDYPTGYLGADCQDRFVLHVTPTGGELTHIPELDPVENGHSRGVRIELDEQGNATTTVSATYFGAPHERLRAIHSQLGAADRPRVLHRYHYLPEPVVDELRLQPAPDAPTVALSFRETSERYARRMGTRLFIPINKLYAYDVVPPATEQRRLPIAADEVGFYIDTVALQLPEGFEVESLGPETIDIEHAVGDYHARLQVTGNQLLWTRTLKLRRQQLPPEAYADYRQFFIDVAKAEKRQVVLRERRT